jgi:hypothetical protein
MPEQDDGWIPRTSPGMTSRIGKPAMAFAALAFALSSEKMR